MGVRGRAGKSPPLKTDVANEYVGHRTECKDEGTCAYMCAGYLQAPLTGVESVYTTREDRAMDNARQILMTRFCTSERNAGAWDVEYKT